VKSAYSSRYSRCIASAVPEAYAYLFLPLGFLLPAIAGVFPVWLWVGVTVFQMVVYTAMITLVAGAVRDASRRSAA